ncbi:tRNA (adenosine(37)-N6)-dimethylallyltransferase MiaA [Rhodoferax sp. 4810]|uniref:tRNA dimethylallyltransferase n=1 Tax=Thiospirillum jenense TaxID=1653858 RepID=A0A839HDC5_9GAMM|nr:tRNA (adenosine(37)-N6)-dimethylallyltransferase MiaA [Thiospirillum jenense]MBB1075828.1 tRNA (adenosine(37)-N6)-dimethylallyltransferase MiaA [Rhodoferax jenense]MBB1126903.1 tRNA (adenosine(37)-N6)-dimethylallyltransferase MiaA [Thiospirillum jenense]
MPQSNQTQPLPLAILLMGPTAAGKSALALALAARLPVELISVDSAQVYRGLDIGTAKPSPAIVAQVPHQLIDICDPSEAYSAARFRDDALAAMSASVAAGKIPLLVGGTMLYFRALQQGLSPLPSAAPAIRAHLTAQAQQRGAAQMHQWLATVDAAAAARIHPNDPQRVQRALEVFLSTGEPLSAHWQRSHAAALPYRLVKLVCAPKDRAVLRARIAERFDAMLTAGFEAEVAQLLARGDLSPDLPALRCVGYRQMVAYLHDQISVAQMRQQAIDATRQLAKRQFTWLRAEMNCQWLQDEKTALNSALELINAAIDTRGV